MEDSTVEEEEVPIHRPVIKETESIILDEEELGYNKNLTKLAGKRGVIKMRVNAEQMLDVVSDKLYPSPKSAVRELYFNEVTACKTARKLYGADPKIQIIINPKKTVRSFEILGIDSMGFSTKMFDQAFCETSASTNIDESETGQFGLGRLSYVKLSPIIRYDVHSRISKEKYAFTLQDAKEMTPVDKPEGLQKFGTKIKVTCKEEVNIDELIPYIEQIARFSQVETELVLLEPLKSEYGKIEKGAGTFRIGSYTKQQYFQKLFSESSKGKEQEKFNIIPIHIENDIIEFDACAIYHKDAFFKSCEKIGEQQITLTNVPIRANIRLPYFSASVLNLKMERTPKRCENCKGKVKHTGKQDDNEQPIYQCLGKCGLVQSEDNKNIPIGITNNREELLEITDKFIGELLQSELVKFFQEQEVTSIEQYYENPLANILTDTDIIKYDPKDDNLDEDGDEKYDQYSDKDALITRRSAINRKTRAFIKFFDTYGVTVQKGRKAEKTCLAHVAKSPETFYIEKLSKVWEDRLHAVHENVRVFTIHRDILGEERINFLRGFKRFGIQDGKEYAKAHKIKAIKKEKADQLDVKVHVNVTGTSNKNRGRSRLRKEIQEYEFEELDTDIISCDTNLRQVTQLVSKLQSDYGACKKLQDDTEATKLSVLIDESLDEEILVCYIDTTNNSTNVATHTENPSVAKVMTFKEVTELADTLKYGVTLIDYPDTIPLKIAEQGNLNIRATITAFGDPNKLFRLGCHLIDNVNSVTIPEYGEVNQFRFDYKDSAGEARTSAQASDIFGRYYSDADDYLTRDGWGMIDMQIIYNKYKDDPNRFQLMWSLIEKVDSSTTGYDGRKIFGVSEILDYIKDYEIDLEVAEDVMSNDLVKHVKALQKPLQKIKDEKQALNESMTDKQIIEYHNYDKLIGACKKLRNSSIYKLQGQHRLNAQIKHYIDAEVPKHITVTGTYFDDGEHDVWTTYDLVLTDFTKTIRLTKELIEILEKQSVVESNKNMTHLKLINEKDKITLEVTIGNRRFDNE